MSVTKIGNSSVNYEVGLFPPKDESKSFLADSVNGHFANDVQVIQHFKENSVCLGRYTHVFVDPRQGDKPTPIDSDMRKGLERILVR